MGRKREFGRRGRSQIPKVSCTVCWIFQRRLNPRFLALWSFGDPRARDRGDELDRKVPKSPCALFPGSLRAINPEDFQLQTIRKRLLPCVKFQAGRRGRDGRGKFGWVNSLAF